MHENLSDRITRTPEGMRLFLQERAIMEVTELISHLMEEQGMTKTDLARQLDTSKANITQMLDGQRNMTIRTISDVLFCLGSALQVSGTTIPQLMDPELPRWHCTEYYPLRRSEASAWNLRPAAVNYAPTTSKMAG